MTGKIKTEGSLRLPCLPIPCSLDSSRTQPSVLTASLRNPPWWLSFLCLCFSLDSGMDTLPTLIPCDTHLCLPSYRTALLWTSQTVFSAHPSETETISFYISSPLPGRTVSQRKDLHKLGSQNLTPRWNSSEWVWEHTRAVLFEPQLLLLDKLLSSSKVKVCFKRKKGVEQGILPHLENQISCLLICVCIRSVF